MIAKIDFVKMVGPYDMPMVALFDTETVTEEEALNYINEGREENSDNFAVVSPETYNLINKAVHEAVQNQIDNNLDEPVHFTFRSRHPRRYRWKKRSERIQTLMKI